MDNFVNKKINLDIELPSIANSDGNIITDNKFVSDTKGDAIDYVDFGETGNQQLVDSFSADIGKKATDFSDSPYPFTDGNWCSQFVSYQLMKNGYDYRWATWAGDETDDNSIFKAMREQGAEIHYDKYASVSGKTPDPSYNPQPGDVFLLNITEEPGDVYPDHVGIVVKDNGDGTVTTIEGNTSGDDGVYDGHGVVAKKIRKRSDIYGYATPKKSKDKKNRYERL